MVEKIGEPHFQLHAPIMSKSLVVTLPFEWSGEELLIQSRAIDETGYVQPYIQELQKIRVKIQFTIIIQLLLGW